MNPTVASSPTWRSSIEGWKEKPNSASVRRKGERASVSWCPDGAAGDPRAQDLFRGFVVQAAASAAPSRQRLTILPGQ